MTEIEIKYVDYYFKKCKCGKRAICHARIPIKYKQNYRVMNKIGDYYFTEINKEYTSNGYIAKFMCTSCAEVLVRSGIAKWVYFDSNGVKHDDRN